METSSDISLNGHLENLKQRRKQAKK